MTEGESEGKGVRDSEGGLARGVDEGGRGGNFSRGQTYW